uniref:Uncharacterized protein n=1 Tax=Aegilops tauschii subsp. strangulata TaxID=200361 RepID=A0A453JMH3_AEGTS
MQTPSDPSALVGLWPPAPARLIELPPWAVAVLLLFARFKYSNSYFRFGGQLPRQTPSIGELGSGGVDLPQIPHLESLASRHYGSRVSIPPALACWFSSFHLATALVRIASSSNRAHEEA